MKYTLIEGELYEGSFTIPCLNYLGGKKIEYALRKVHEGICGNHLGARTIPHKLIQVGYYWPKMKRDATVLVLKCEKC